MSCGMLVANRQDHLEVFSPRLLFADGPLRSVRAGQNPLVALHSFKRIPRRFTVARVTTCEGKEY